MPNSPHTWMDLLASIPAVVWGFFMAFIVAILRVVYDKEETTRMRICLEALLCGFLTLAAASVITWLELPESLSVAVGGAVGFIGTVKLREVALRYIDWFGRSDKK